MLAKNGSKSYKNVKAVLSLLGICVAAGYLVPQFCNMFMPPVMKKLMPSYDPNAGASSQPVQAPQSKPTNKPAFKANNRFTTLNVYPKSFTYFHSGMKV